MRADKERVLIHRFQPALPKPRAFGVAKNVRVCAAHELPRCRPIDQAQTCLESARPVGPHPVRACAEPALQMLPHAGEVAWVVRKRVSLCERDEVQMAVDLPDVLDIAYQ